MFEIGGGAQRWAEVSREFARLEPLEGPPAMRANLDLYPRDELSLAPVTRERKRRR